MTTSDPKTLRALIYTRISRDDTGEGVANERQEEDCRTLARLRGWTVVGVEADISVSAYSGKRRPGWDRVLDKVRAREVDVVIAWHMDRITRTVRELVTIVDLCRETNVAIATVNGDIDLSNDTGRMVATILGAVAEAEVERKGARQKSANAQRRAQGKRWSSGWRPFGYELDGTIVPDEAALIRQAAEDVLNDTPLKAIARRWRDAGVSTPRSRKGADGWTHNGVRTILLNPRNAGLNTYKGDIVGKGDWEPILTEEIHTRLVAKLTDPRRKTHAADGRPPANLLSGIAVCGVCDKPVRAGTIGRTAQKGGKRETVGRIPVYKCPSDHIAVERDEADAFVTSVVGMNRAAILAGAADWLGDGQSRANASEAVQTLIAERDRIAENLREVAISFAESRITIEQLEAATKSLTGRRQAIEAELSQLEEVASKSDHGEAFVAGIESFHLLEVAERRRMLGSLARVTLHPRGRGKRNVPTDALIDVDLVVRWPGSTETIAVPVHRRDGSLSASADELNELVRQRRSE